MGDDTRETIRDIDAGLLGVIRLTTDMALTEASIVRKLIGISLAPMAFRILTNVQASSPRLMQLREMIGLSQPAVTVRVQELEKKGLVQRVRDPGDRRGTIIEITAEGRQILDMAGELRESALRQTFEGWETDDLLSLARLLHRLESDTERTLASRRQEYGSRCEEDDGLESGDAVADPSA